MYDLIVAQTVTTYLTITIPCIKIAKYTSTNQSFEQGENWHDEQLSFIFCQPLGNMCMWSASDRKQRWVVWSDTYRGPGMSHKEYNYSILRFFRLSRVRACLPTCVV